MNLTLIIKCSKNFLNPNQIEKFAEFLFNRFGIDKNNELNILLCDDNGIKALNARFKKKDEPTNVLSFYGYDGNILGDIAISLDTIEKEAIEKNIEIPKYLLFIIAHGFLHLLGYTHETMEKFEDIIKIQCDLVDKFLKGEKEYEKETSS